MGKISLVDKMRIQTLREQRLGAEAIMAAYTESGQRLGPQHSEEDLPAC